MVALLLLVLFTARGPMGPSFSHERPQIQQIGGVGGASSDTVPFDGKVDIGGRSVRIACRGKGAPTVLVETGLGASATNNPSWRAIAERVAPATRICLYDRAGRGESDPAIRNPRSSDDVVADLHAALAKARIAAPYVLVGHSLGGIHVLDFARLFPREVAAMVLVDSSHPDQVDAWRRVFPQASPGEPAATSHARDVLAKLDSADNSEAIDIGKSYAEARLLKSLGSRPVIVLTHNPKWKMVPGLPEPISAQLEAENQRLQRDFLKLSSRSTQRISVNGGHELQSEDPNLVVSGIFDAVKAARLR